MSTQALPEDIFRRKPVAQRMCKIIAELAPSAISPLALDGSWGCGKTIHAQRLKEEFESKYKDSIKCIYWNACESDFSENPILALVASLYQQIPEAEKRKAFAKRAFALFSGFLIGGSSFIANQYLNYQTGGVWNFILSSKWLQKAIGCARWLHGKAKKQEENFERILKEFSEEEERIKAARELVNIVREDKELVILIDELDRCRPDFALKMLESIKYLFEES
ncbi:MAG: P-loop NTPase fold protein [Faecousia sp.]